MNKPNYSDMMNAQELVQITPEWNQPIEKGTLIGFAGLGGTKITAAYPLYKLDLVNKEILFVLYTSLNGRPCIDGTRFHFERVGLGISPIFINKEPIVVEISDVTPITSTERVMELFNGKPK